MWIFFYWTYILKLFIFRLGVCSTSCVVHWAWRWSFKKNINNYEGHESESLRTGHRLYSNIIHILIKFLFLSGMKKEKFSCI